ncbi:MAG: class I SAM-dependent methyltransferase [Acetobacteraceae bacterium]
MGLIGRFTDYDDPSSLGPKLRKRRGQVIADLIRAIHRTNHRCRILDIGGEASYWNIFDRDFLQQHDVTITLLNNQPDRIGSIDKAIFRMHIGDACRLDYGDNTFDLAHSNSVLEHVGDWPRMVAFAGETRRVALHYYVQMPFFWFPIEPHFGTPFFHWLPEPVRVAWIRRRPIGQYHRASTMDEAMEYVQDARLLDRKQFAALFPDASIRSERMFGMTKSLIAIRGPQGLTRIAEATHQVSGSVERSLVHQAVASRRDISLTLGM